MFKSIGLPLLFSVLFFVSCQPKEEKKSDPPPPPVKNERPEMTVKLLDGRSLTMRNLEENMILIFFQPDCNHCQVEARAMQKKINEFSKYQMYFISSYPLAVIDKFATDYQLAGIPYVHFGYANGEDVRNNYGMIETPAIYIYKSNGALVKDFYGIVDVDLIIRYL